MAAPRYDCNEPHVGALMELSAAAASLSGFAKQPDHALEHVVCAMELVKRAHRRHIDTRAPSVDSWRTSPIPVFVENRAALASGAWELAADMGTFRWVRGQSPFEVADHDWIEVVW